MTTDRTSAIADLVAAVGPHWNEVGRILRVNDGHWRVRLSDGLVIGLTHEPERGALVAGTRLMRDDRSNRLDVATALLRLNALDAETGGLRLGLTADDEIELVLAIADDVDNLEVLLPMLQHLASFARSCRALAAPPASAAADLPVGVQAA